MKKHLLLLVLIFLYAISHAQKTVTIGILVDKITNNTELLNQLENEIKTIVGQEATIVFGEILANNFDVATAKSNYQKLLSNKTDIILTFGIVDNIVLYKEKNFPKPVIVFGSINGDFFKLSENKKTSGINNITYIVPPSSYAKDLEEFSKLYDYKTLGIMVDDYLPKTLPIKDLFDAYFSNKASSYKLITINESTNFSNLLNDVDAIYLTGGFNFSDINFKKLVSAINQKKLPSFSSVRKADVERGILASNQPENNIDQFFRRIALNIEAIIGGTNPSELPLYLTYKNKLTINYTTAEQINFPIRYSMMVTADVIGGNVEVVPKSSLSIVDIMKSVVDKNLSLKVAKKDTELALQDIKTAKSNYLPDVSAKIGGTYIDPRVAQYSAGQNPEFSTAGNITVQQLIYSESASAGIDIKESLEKAQQESYNAAELDALLNATTAYFNALVLKTNASIQNQNLQVTKRNLELSEQNFQAGASGKSDVLRFKSELAQNIQSLITAKNQLSQAYFTINQLMNVDISTKIAIKDAEISKGVFKNYNYTEMIKLLDDPKSQPKLIAFLIEEAKQNAPELKNLGHNLNVIERNYKLNDKGRFIPTVALQGQYNLGFSESGKGSVLPIGSPNIPDGTYNLGLNISLPIFQQNQRKTNRQTAKIQTDQLLIQKEDTEQSIAANINTIVLDIVNEIANIEISKVAENTAKESLELTQNAYQEGAVPVIQLIDAQTNYLQAQLTSATANYNYLLVSMQLERAMGYFFLINSTTSNQAFIQRATQFILNNN